MKMWKLYATAVFLGCFFNVPNVAAQNLSPTFSFNPFLNTDPNSITIAPRASCHVNGYANYQCEHGDWNNDPDPTPFFMENITYRNTLPRETYYHVIVGDAADGFAQEVYIKWGASSEGVTNDSFSGGQTGNLYATTFANLGGNGMDPLNKNAVYTGNGSGNPDAVVMRMIMSDGEIEQEFLKENFETKPKITQVVTTPEMVQSFSADMSMLTYSQLNQSAPVAIMQTLSDEAIPGDARQFDLTVNQQKSSVTAGRYIYSPGNTVYGWKLSGKLDTTNTCTDPVLRDQLNSVNPGTCSWGVIRAARGGSDGSYLYSDRGGFDPYAIDYMDFRRSLQNPFPATKN